MSLDEIKIAFEIIQSLSTTVAIIVGGIWTYFLFIKNRLNYPTVKIKIQPQKILLPNKKYLIHVKVVIENASKIILKSKYAKLRLRSVVPLPPDVEELVNKDFDPIHEGQNRVVWPLIAAREWQWGVDRFEIEPSEEGTLHTDFIISGEISVIELYVFINNAKKRDIGWAETLIYEL